MQTNQLLIIDIQERFSPFCTEYLAEKSIEYSKQFYNKVFIYDTIDSEEVDVFDCMYNEINNFNLISKIYDRK